MNVLSVFVTQQTINQYQMKQLIHLHITALHFLSQYTANTDSKIFLLICMCFSVNDYVSSNQFERRKKERKQSEKQIFCILNQKKTLVAVEKSKSIKYHDNNKNIFL